MVTIKPFAALRPDPEKASRICAPPYDVLSTEEARHAARDNPLSFLHVSKPEIDLAPSTDPTHDSVYRKGAENFKWMIDHGLLIQDPRPGFYLYRLAMDRHTQVGLVAAASCADYLDGYIKKHELTRPDKENDRVRHIEALEAHTGPVFLTYRDDGQINRLAEGVIAGSPEIDFTADDGVRHTAWTIRDEEQQRILQEYFQAIPALYIADGHHRCAAAARVYETRLGAGRSRFFLAVLFPHNQMRILPYNRIVKDLNGMTAAEFLERIDRTASRENADGAVRPERKHEVGLYLEGNWHRVRFRPELLENLGVVEALDVSLLQRFILQPMLGIEDPRTSERIHFVGGSRGTSELERHVDSGAYACAFSLFPTGIEDLIAVSDAGDIMPPKSTWFEPKLRDAMFCHRIN